MSNRTQVFQTIHDAKASTGMGTSVDVTPFRHVMVVFSTASSADLTVKCAGSLHKPSDVDFTASAAVDNEWDYVGMYNLNSASFIAGDDGVAYSGTDAVEQLMVNVDGLRSLNFNVTARVAGSITIKCFAVTNQ